MTYDCYSNDGYEEKLHLQGVISEKKGNVLSDICKHKINSIMNKMKGMYSYR